MKRIIITLGAAILVAVPAVVGFFGNASFAPSVAVRVPPHAIVLPAVDDHGGQSKSSQAGDDSGSHGGGRSGKGGGDDGSGDS